MAGVLAIALAASQCGGGPGPVVATRPDDSLTLDDRRRIVSAMDAFVREHFAHGAALAPGAYDAALARFRTFADSAADRRAFDRAALEFSAALQNGHTSFSDAWLDRVDGQRLWLSLWPTAEGWTVLSSEVPGLGRGSVVTHVNGGPIDTAYQRARPFLSASGERTRRYLWSFTDYLWPREMTLTLRDGSTIPVTRGVPNDSVVTASRAGQPLVPHRWLVPDSVAYVRVPRFSPERYADSAMALIAGAFAAAPALVVDVRGNGGGNTPRALIAQLSADRGGRPLAVERSTIAADRLRFLNRLRPAGARSRYRGRLVILIDHRCASACEDFVAPFADSRYALVIGDTTWGSTGQPRFLELGNGMQFQVSARRYRRPNGEPFEGVGIPPHLVVPISASALRAGRDDALERALEELRQGRPALPPR